MTKKENQPSHGPHPEAIRAQQELLAKLWHQLPPEHQASVALALAQAVLEGEQGAWLSEALELREPQESDSRLQPFPVTSLCRADLEEHFSPQQIARFDDADMGRLAEVMGERYVDHSFWGDLALIGRRILEEKDDAGAG